MLKGVNRNVIVVRANRKSRFEAVYFVMKKGGGTDRADMVKEANRIIHDSEMISPTKKGRLASVMAVTVGMAIGALIASAIWLSIMFFG